MQPRLKQRKTKIVSGWLTRDDQAGTVVLWDESVERDHLCLDDSGYWKDRYCDRIVTSEIWWENEFKSLYAGIPRKGRAVRVEIEIVVD